MEENPEESQPTDEQRAIEAAEQIFRDIKEGKEPRPSYHTVEPLPGSVNTQEATERMEELRQQVVAKILGDEEAVNVKPKIGGNQARDHKLMVKVPVVGGILVIRLSNDHQLVTGTLINPEIDKKGGETENNLMQIHLDTRQGKPHVQVLNSRVNSITGKRDSFEHLTDHFPYFGPPVPLKEAARNAMNQSIQAFNQYLATPGK